MFLEVLFWPSKVFDLVVCVVWLCAWFGCMCGLVVCGVVVCVVWLCVWFGCMWCGFGLVVCVVWLWFGCVRGLVVCVVWLYVV
jgi:hypothetical protein